MIKTLFLFILIVVLAWLSQDYFSTDLPKQKHKVVFPIHHNKKIKQITPSEANIKIDASSSNSAIDTLSDLLNENKFYDALSLYLENNTAKNMKLIENYLANLAKNNPQQALEYMQQFLDNEPQSSVIRLMIKTYIEQEEYAKAIALIMELKENYVSESEDKRLSTALKDIALQHIDALAKRKEYATLIGFLEDMIAYDSTDNFYSYRLAQLYMELDKTKDATVLLEALKYDEVYAQNVKTLLNSIDKEKEEEYTYAIPLQQVGEHYIVHLLLDGTSFNLLLDTGATFILIDEDKASMLEVLRDDLILQTAGGNVEAKLCNVSRLEVGNLTLSNLKVTASDFKREGIDGLLGMNFFKQFTFFLNQDENVLYLNPK